jgi:hypothetical protein
VASAANGSNSKATYFPDLEVHAMPVAWEEKKKI